MAIILEQLKITIKEENKHLESNIQKQLQTQKSDLTALFKQNISLINKRIDTLDGKINDIGDIGHQMTNWIHQNSKQMMQPRFSTIP